jgi:acetyl-CoA C-acetyltransferase
VTLPWMQIDRRCGSGLQAVVDAGARIQTGVADLVISGGAESTIFGTRQNASAGGEGDS